MKISNSNVIVLDNGGSTLDRYTIVYLDMFERGVYFARGCCENPSAPNGVGCSVEVTQEWLDQTSDKILTLDKIPNSLMVLIEADLMDFKDKPEDEALEHHFTVSIQLTDPKGKFAPWVKDIPVAGCYTFAEVEKAAIKFYQETWPTVYCEIVNIKLDAK